jgi:hypothetical protein
LEHLGDYLSPYTDAIQPLVDKLKDYVAPYLESAKDNLAPALESAKETGKELMEKGKEKASQAKDAIKNKADGTNPLNKKVIAIAAVCVLVLGASVALMIGGKSEGGGTLNPGVVIPPLDDATENEIILGTEPPVEDRGELKDTETRPTFTINGIEYAFGCQLSALLKDVEIENIDTYLHYNKKALIIPAGKTREWAVIDKDGNKFYVEVYNPTDQELSSEHCKVFSIYVDTKDCGNLNAVMIGDKINMNMKAKDLVDILGQVSGRDQEENGEIKANRYWWTWFPYADKGDYAVYINVRAHPDTGDILSVFIRDETIVK